jgi:hypothetical protein
VVVELLQKPMLREEMDQIHNLADSHLQLVVAQVVLVLVV